MTDSELPPWAPRELFCQEVFDLTIRVEESFEMPQVTLEYPCQQRTDGYKSVELTPQDAHELAKELRQGIKIATRGETPTRRSIFLHHIQDEDSFDPETGFRVPLEPGEILVYADSFAVVLDFGFGEIPPVMSDDLSSKEAAAVEAAVSELADRGYRPFEVQQFAAFHPTQARTVVEVLEAAIAALD